MTPTELFESHTGIVGIIAKSFSGYLNGEEKAVTFDDLKSEGMIALHLASLNYDEEREAKFPSYASVYISRAMSNLLYKHRLTIRHPRTVILAYQKVAQLIQNQQTTIDELFDCNQITSTEKLRYLAFTSIDSNQTSDVELFDDYNAPELLDELEKAISQLNPIQQMIIRKNFGIGFNEKMTLEEIGKELGLDKGAVSERKRKIIRILKEKLK
jgi:RNA polymerase sigma factor (sigma-70 family)